MWWFTTLRRASIVAALTLGMAGCTSTDGPVGGVQVPFVSATPVAAPQQDDQQLRVSIVNGKFDASIYSEQSGETQMLVSTAGGPYLFEISGLVDRRELPESGSTLINYETSAPGYYTIRAYLSTPEGPASTDTAVLQITSVGT
jgi:hypothetical protein